MEKNVAIVDIDKYTNLIIENRKQRENIEDLYEKLRKFYSSINDKIYKDEEYYFKRMLENNNDDYYRDVITEKFYEYGIDDIDYINEQIDIKINNLKKEKEANDEKDN